MNVTFNGATLVTQTQANLAIDILNKAEYSAPYVNVPATNTMFFPDSTRATTSAGIVTKKELTALSATASVLLPLNRYQFFNSLINRLAPLGKRGIELTIETDTNLLFGNAATATHNCSLEIQKMRLFVPKITLNTEGANLYANYITSNPTWNFYEFQVEMQSQSTDVTGNWKINSNITKPRHVFIWVKNNADFNSYQHNLYWH